MSWDSNRVRVVAPTREPAHDRLLMMCRSKARLILKGEWDNWTAVTGAEGSGKSTLAITAACYTDPTFIHDWRNRIAYTAEQFTDIVIDLVDKGKRCRSVCLDEAAESWMSQEWATNVQRALTKLSVQIRYAGLDVYLCSPTLKLLGAGAVRRCRDWYYCELKAGYERGWATIYRAVEKPFSKFRTPYFMSLFWHRFDPLPDWLYERYKRFKILEARKRLGDYADVAAGREPERKERATPAPVGIGLVEGVVEEVMGRGDLLKLINERGTLSPEVLMSYYPTKLNRDRARTASRLLKEKLATLGQVQHETVRKEAGA